MNTSKNPAIFPGLNSGGQTARVAFSHESVVLIRWTQTRRAPFNLEFL